MLHISVKYHCFRAGLFGLLIGLCSPMTASTETATPEALVRDTSSRMLVALKQEKDVIEQDQGRLYDLVAEIVLPYFDFQRMSRLALGKYWRKATPEQQQRFVEQFRVMLIRTYGNALVEYSDETIVYLPVLAKQNAKVVTIRTEIELAGGMPLQIHYDMFNSSAGWKVYDIAINGVSLVTNYRTTFGSIVRKSGMDDLIKQLAARNGLES